MLIAYVEKLKRIHNKFSMDETVLCYPHEGNLQMKEGYDPAVTNAEERYRPNYIGVWEVDLNHRHTANEKVTGT